MQPVPCLESVKEQLGFLVTIILGDDSLSNQRSLNPLDKGHRNIAFSREGMTNNREKISLTRRTTFPLPEVGAGVPLPLVLGPNLMDPYPLLLPLVLNWNQNSLPEAVVSLFLGSNPTPFRYILPTKIEREINIWWKIPKMTTSQNKTKLILQRLQKVKVTKKKSKNDQGYKRNNSAPLPLDK